MVFQHPQGLQQFLACTVFGSNGSFLVKFTEVEQVIYRISYVVYAMGAFVATQSGACPVYQDADIEKLIMQGANKDVVNT